MVIAGPNSIPQRSRKVLVDFLRRFRVMHLNEVRIQLVRAVFVCALVACAVSMSPLCQGQSDSATLGGVVEDQSGGVLPGAHLLVTNVETKAVRKISTNQSGVFSVPGLNPGNYTIRVQHPGFDDVEVNDVTLNIGDSRQMEI